MRLGSGTYDKLRILQTGVQPHKEGEPKITFVLGLPDDEDMTVFDNMYTSNDAWDKFTKRRLLAYGFDADTTPLFDLEGDNSPVVGNLVGPVVVGEEKYTKKDGTEGVSSKVLRVGEFVSERLAPEDVKSLETALSARLGIKKQGARKATPRPAPVASAPLAATGTDADVPF